MCYYNFMTLSRGNISLLLISAIIFSFSFGVATMRMNEKGNMSDCPFANTATICPMTLFEHIGIFQSTFRAIPSKAVLSAMLALAFLLMIFPKTIPNIYSPQNSLNLFIRNTPERPIYNKLLLALSDGILQPKLYSNA